MAIKITIILDDADQSAHKTPEVTVTRSMEKSINPLTGLPVEVASRPGLRPEELRTSSKREYVAGAGGKVMQGAIDLPRDVRHKVAKEVKSVTDMLAAFKRHDGDSTDGIGGGGHMIDMSKPKDKVVKMPEDTKARP